MIHYVSYSNTYTHDEKPRDEYGIENRSSVKASLGGWIWFISGTASPNQRKKQFRLCFTFNADRIEAREDDKRWQGIYGATGRWFDTPVLLDQLPWFRDLHRTQFFSRSGLVEIKASEKLSEIQASEVVAGLEALALLAPEQKEHDDGDSDVVLTNLADVDRQLADDIAESLTLSDSERAARLAEASSFPERIEVYTTAFLRNAHVIVEVLKRANGICELCKQKAPFLKRRDGTPYLEVHHWKRLSDGGEDTIENAAALCPNCHREAHYGPRMG